MKHIEARVEMYVGESNDSKGFTEMVYNPYEQAVIFRDNDDNEIWLDPEGMKKMVTELSAFVELLERMGVKTKSS